jgi:hypothetical protein
MRASAPILGCIPQVASVACLLSTRLPSLSSPKRGEDDFRIVLPRPFFSNESRSTADMGLPSFNLKFQIRTASSQAMLVPSFKSEI